MDKQCKQCKQIKSLKSFERNRQICNTCRSKNKHKNYKQKHGISYHKQHRLDNINRGMCGHCGTRPLTNHKTLCDTCKQRGDAQAKKLKLRLKQEVFNAYGGCKCACCGETTLMFLTIDHINNDGKKHRLEITNGKYPARSSSLYYWLRNNNYPEGYQVLCFNCNVGRHLNGGTCPHKEH